MSFLILYFFLLIIHLTPILVIILLIRFYIKLPKLKRDISSGKYEENRIVQILLSIKSPEEKVLQNLYIPKNNNETTEIDIIYISLTGIYCIEAKDYAAWIYGTRDQTHWTAVYSNGKKVKLLNPIIQNKSHIKHLKNILPNVPIRNMVVFSDRGTLKNITLDENLTQNHHFEDLMKWHRGGEIVLSPEQIETIYNILEPYTQVSEEIKQKHIQNIRKNNLDISNR